MASGPFKYDEVEGRVRDQNYHDQNPFDMTGPEFEGLTFDEKWELKKQLRIRDRNKRVSQRLRRADQRNWDAALGFLIILVAVILGACIHAALSQG
jgi:hypothetical protein